MFLNGLLFGVGWVVGVGGAVTILIGLTVLMDYTSQKVTKPASATQKAEGQKQPLTAYHAKLVFFVRLPDTEDEQMKLGNL